MLTTSQLCAVGWLVAAIALGALEAVTVQLLAIWFAAGAVVTMFVALTGVRFAWQLICFALVSALFFALTRPFVKEKLQVKQVRTNVDRIVGTIGVVVQPIDNSRSQGRVHISGLDWTARSEDGIPIPEGEEVLIKQIDGAKVIVERI